MNRRKFLVTATTAALAASTARLQAQASPPSTGNALLKNSAPVLMNASETEVTLLLAVSEPSTGWVEYGTTEALGLRCDGIMKGQLPLEEKLLRFHLRGLKPGTSYFYRVCTRPVVFDLQQREPVGTRDTVQSEPGSFRTLDHQAASATFTVWNDTHENVATLAPLADALRAHPTDFLMWNGDLTNNLRKPDDVIRHFVINAGHPFADRTPLFLGRGNHDVRGRYAWDLPRMVSGPGGHYYYAFRQGPLACVVLDTGEDKPDNHPSYAGLANFESYREEQRIWLEQIVEEPWFKEAPFRIAFPHIPLVWDGEVPANWPNVWGTGVKGWICMDGYLKWTPILNRAKVDMVISGHTHRYAYFPANEKRNYVQVIGGGPRPEGATIITGHATAAEMVITTTDLKGKVLFEVRLPSTRNSS
jgi:hypothetical protein